jgi:hypothetical protein
MAPKARFGGFLVIFEVLMLVIDDLWGNIDAKEGHKGDQPESWETGWFTPFRNWKAG